MRINQAAKNDQLSARNQYQNQHGGEVETFHESLGGHRMAPKCWLFELRLPTHHRAEWLICR